MTEPLDMMIIGAGFAGMYLLHRLRAAGFAVKAVEAAPEVGGTWYHNRYPGLRCDVESLEYQYSWSDDLRHGWRWSERFSAQPEIMRYAQWVADQLDLRRDILFNARVVAAIWDEAAQVWHATTEAGATLTARNVVFATGALAVPRMPNIPGLESYSGRLIHTADWPKDAVDLAGQRVGLIGTGSSGLQVATALAGKAGRLQVFQRSPAYSIPAQNRALTAADYDAFEGNLAKFDSLAMAHRGGIATPLPTSGAQQVGAAELEAELSARWQHGGAFTFLSSFNDIQTDPASNRLVADFVRARIRETVKDPETAEMLVPTYPFATRRTCVDTGYYQIFNRGDVDLVDVSDDPIAAFTEIGLRLASGADYSLDTIILATGYDAMTGAFLAVDVTGRNGLTNRRAWAEGPVNLLGLMIAGFPNLFTVTGPGSPSVLTNVIRSIEYHVDWLTRCFTDLRAQGVGVIEATPQAQADWVAHVNEVANRTLFTKTPSWYCGADIPGKPKVFMPYAGGLPAYRDKAEAMARAGYAGFALTGEGGR